MCAEFRVFMARPRQLTDMTRVEKRTIGRARPDVQANTTHASSTRLQSYKKLDADRQPDPFISRQKIMKLISETKQWEVFVFPTPSVPNYLLPK